jgi:hypothetical protein
VRDALTNKRLIERPWPLAASQRRPTHHDLLINTAARFAPGPVLLFDAGDCVCTLWSYLLMKMTLLHRLAIAATIPLLGAGVSHASLVVAGSLQSEQGNPGDWDPPNSTLIMTDNGGGMHSVTANNLGNGVFYEFKVLDDGGTPPANWGDPEVVNTNTMAYGDADGSVLISVNTNLTNGNGGKVVWVNSDGIPMQVVGDFMNEAGGAADWTPNDAAFAMTSEGAGLYSFYATISTPGSYQFKATDGAGWNYQVGPDGFGSNASTFAFTTTMANERILMSVDVANGQLGVVSIPEPSAALLMGFVASAIAATRRVRG